MLYEQAAFMYERQRSGKAEPGPDRAFRLRSREKGKERNICRLMFRSLFCWFGLRVLPPGIEPGLTV